MEQLASNICPARVAVMLLGDEARPPAAPLIINDTQTSLYFAMGFASLPPEIIRLVSQFLLRDETASNRTLILTAFCGVCRRWRDVGGETGEAALAFDSTDSQHGAKTTLPAFKKASGACKRALFLGASRLLTGYSELTLSGEAINDQMLINIAVTNGPALSSLKLQGTPTVTDAGLCTLISAAPNLKLFLIEDAGQGVVGHFVPALLQHCKQLETLLIEGAESMDWPALRLSWAPAMAAAAATAAQDADSLAAAAAAGGRQVQQQQQQPSASAGASSSRIQAQHHQQLQQASLSARDSAHDLHPNSSSRRGNSSRSSTAAQASYMDRTQSQPNSAQTGASSSRHSMQQQQEGRLALPLAPRISISSSSCSGHSEFSSCQEEAVISDDGGSSSSSSSSSGRSVDARSDSTSISMPPQAVEALAVQLQQLLSPNEQQQHQQPAAAAAGEPGTVDESPSSSSNARAQAGRSDTAGSSDGQQQRRRRGSSGSSRPCHAALRRLRVRFSNVDTLQQLLECVPGLTELQVDGPALSVQAAAVMCPGLRRLSYLVCSPSELDAALLCLSSMRNLRALELEVKGMVLSTEQLRVIGLLPLRELCLDSHAYRQHPSMPRPQYSHLDNDGVKGLVDSICSRMRAELMPLKLSLCGATALKQEAVSALLRLPILASIDTGGCVKLTPMDRMRLVAKVKAGQGLMDKTGAAGGAAGTAGGRLHVPHVLL